MSEVSKIADTLLNRDKAAETLQTLQESIVLLSLGMSLGARGEVLAKFRELMVVANRAATDPASKLRISTSVNP